MTLVEDMIWTHKILLHFTILLQQNIKQFSQNPPIYQKRQNDVLRGNLNMDVSSKSGNFDIGRRPYFSASISYIYEKAIKQKEPLRGAP